MVSRKSKECPVQFLLSKGLNSNNLGLRCSCAENVAIKRQRVRWIWRVLAAKDFRSSVLAISYVRLHEIPFKLSILTTCLLQSM